MTTRRFKQKLLRIKAEIEEELRQLDDLYQEYQAHTPIDPTDSFSLRGLGSVLHDFYNGVERVFERIAQELNGKLPEGNHWHIQLLKDMHIPIEGLRPAVISKNLFGLLKDFLEFRHRFRNIYGLALEWEKLKVLNDKFPMTIEKFREEIQNFLRFLNGLAENI